MPGNDKPHINDLLVTLQKGFLNELYERVDNLEALTLAYDQHGFNASDFDELFRAVHSLKGAAGTFGLSIISAISHAYEDYLKSTQHRDAQYLNNCLNYVDLLRSAAKEIHRGQTDFSSLEEDIRNLRERHFAKPYTALLVEPSKLHAQLCQQALAGLPIQAVQIDDGLQALTRLMSEPFDLLITSQEIKTLNGLALIAALRLANRPGKPIKSILLTSRTSDIESPIQPDHVIQKNQHLEESLIQAVTRALNLDT